MANEEEKLATLKANIKRLIKLRGDTLGDVSREMKVSYTGLSHLLCDATYKTERGTICKYKFLRTRKAISDFIQVPYYDLWSKGGNKIVTSLIEIEIAKAVRVLVDQNLTLYKPKR